MLDVTEEASESVMDSVLDDHGEGCPQAASADPD